MINDVAQQVVRRLGEVNQTLCTAESCTGGQIAVAITNVPGASNIFLGGIVAYANTAKHNLLGVAEAVLAEHGAVSEPVARQMALGARERFGADYAVSTTGIAGPGGGTDAKPVGLVCIAWASPEGVKSVSVNLPGNREEIQAKAVLEALQGILACI